VSAFSKWLKRAALIAILAGGTAGGWYLWQQHHAATETKAAPKRREREAVAVTVAPVTMRPVRRAVGVVGSLYGRDEVMLTPKVEGRVLRIHRDVGDVVKPGDLLLEIDPTDYQLAVTEARRSLDLELSRLGLKEPPGANFEVRTLPAVERAASMERNAHSRCERARKLLNIAASAEDREQAETDLSVAHANHQQALVDAEGMLATVRHRQALLETAWQRLRDTRVIVPVPGAATPPEVIRAGFQEATTPTDYVVCQRSVTEGEIVRTGTTSYLFQLVIDRPLKLQAPVPERHARDVAVGQKVELEAECCPGERVLAVVARVNPVVDRASRTFQVEIHVPNAERKLKAGSFARASILTRVDPQARTVPEEALVRFAGVTKVFVVRDGKAQEVPVTAGVTGNEKGNAWVEVTGNLPADASVVTSGQSQLAAGRAIRLKDTQSK